MTTSCPAFATSQSSVEQSRRPAKADDTSNAVSGTWRYSCRRSSRGVIILAAITSALLHGAMLLPAGHAKKKAAPPKEEERVIALVVMPEIKDLEEPDPVRTDEAEAPVDPGVLVPMQPDLPQVFTPHDFVQHVNLDSLINRMDVNETKLVTIPENRASGRLADKLGKIFNLADLDRVPEPLVQPSPLYPAALRGEGINAEVQVEFVVDINGNVLNAIVVQATHGGFEDAAINGVLKWKFRPGMRGGRKVNTRMLVPIRFKIHDNPA